MTPLTSTLIFGFVSTFATASATSCIAQSAALLVPGHNIGAIQLGESRSMTHKALGVPALSFQRTVDIVDEMWFPKSPDKYKKYVSILFRNGKAIQIEVPLPEGSERGITVALVRRKYHHLNITALGYNMGKHVGQDGFDAENALYEEKTHFQGNAVSYYYDAIPSGIAFSLGVQDFFDGSAKFQKVIIHKAGSKVIPPLAGKQQKPTDEIKDARHPPGF